MGRLKYLDSFTLASADEEAGFVLSYPAKLEMQCYSDSAYPFKIFPQKKLRTLRFEQITLLYGGNGSGKSTLLNVIAEKLSLERRAPFNYTPLFEDYLAFCSYVPTAARRMPAGSAVITSDDVFDFLLDLRAINAGVDRRREALFEEYDRTKETKSVPLRSLEDYDALKRFNEGKRSTKSAYVTRRLSKSLNTASNGESAFAYFSDRIGENALYLLDEPENSLSAKLQEELAKFIEDSARFYGCQFVISTHSPFLLALKGACIYDLDAVPACERRWTELENVRIYRDFFEKHRSAFQK